MTTWRVRTKNGSRLLEECGYVGIGEVAARVRKVEEEAYSWGIREAAKRLSLTTLTVELSTGAYIDIETAVSLILGLAPGGYEEGPG